MLESLTAETEGAPAATVESNRQKLATVNQALLEQHTYSTLVQCYNAAYYFLTASTAPTTVRAEQRVGGAKAAPGVATGAAGTTTATAMAITPAGMTLISSANKYGEWRGLIPVPTYFNHLFSCV